MWINPQQAPIPTSQIAQLVLDQTQMIYRAVRRRANQAYIKYKAHYDKTAKTTKPKEAEYVFVLHPKADQQGSKIRFMEFRCIGANIIEKVLSNNIYLVRKISTNKTQVLHRIRSSHPDNAYLIYKQRQKNRSLIWKWASSTMICMPERGSVNMRGQFSTPRTVIQRHSIQPIEEDIDNMIKYDQISFDANLMLIKYDKIQIVDTTEN